MEPEVQVGGRPRSRRRPGLIAAGLGLAFALVSYVAVSLYAAHVLTSPKPRPGWVDPRLVALDAEPWSARTEDGLTLRGWFFPAEVEAGSTPADRRLIVIVHGLWDCWDLHAPQARDLRARGYDVLSFDLRGHGKSDPTRLSMGRRERGDLRAVLAWAEGRGYDPARIGWLGYSMGGATIVMEAASNPSIRVAAIDSPFGDLPAVLDAQLSRHSGLPGIFNPGILLAARLAFDARSDDLVPIESAARWGRRPLLLIHGTADHLVPVEQAMRLADSVGPTCRPLILPGVGHIQAYEEDPAGYIDRLDHFFDANLGVPRAALAARPTAELP